jgi:flavin prenyltransferase
LAPAKVLYNRPVEIVVGISGASGARLGTRFLELAAACRQLDRIHLTLSEAALRVARNELSGKTSNAAGYLRSLSLSSAARRHITLYEDGEVEAPIASGSYPIDGMIVIPCSAGTLGAIANGISRGLLQRAADVALKERRPLVLALRESPYSLVHIENMRKAVTAGAVIAPPVPAFYAGAVSLEQMIDIYCARAARYLGLKLATGYTWSGPRRR